MIQAEENLMSITDSATRYFDALAEAQTALLDAARAAGSNQLSIQQRLMTEVQTAQRRNLELARRVAEQPTDIAGNVSAFIEATGEAQNQTLNVARLLIEGAPEARTETRAQFERISKANQEVVRAAITAVRDLYTSNPWVQLYRTNVAEPVAAATSNGKKN
jgi:hypothetical protein